MEWSLPSSANKVYFELEEISKEMRKGIPYPQAVEIRARALGKSALPTADARVVEENTNKSQSTAIMEAMAEELDTKEGFDKTSKVAAGDGDTNMAAVELKNGEENIETEEGKPPLTPTEAPKPSTAMPALPTVGKRPFVKPLRAEWNRSCSPSSFFSKNLYVANLNPVSRPANLYLTNLGAHIG